MIKYFETLRAVLSIYDQINNTKSRSGPIANGTMGLQSASDLLNSQYFVDLYLMQFRFIQDSFRQVGKVL